MRPSAIPLVAILVIVSGCTSPSTQEPAEPEGDDALDRLGYVSIYNGTLDDALESVLLVRIPIEQIQSHLPEGWVAADANGLFGVPAATGFGLLVLDTYIGTFDGAQLASSDIGIAVESPDTPLGDADLNVYQFAMLGEPHPWVDLLVPYGWPHQNATLELEPGAAPAVGGATITTADGEYSWEGLGSARQQFSSTTRFWSEVPGGLLVNEFHVAADVFLGPASSCSFPAGSIPATVAGSTDCSAGEGLVLQIPAFDVAALETIFVTRT